MVGRRLSAMVYAGLIETVPCGCQIKIDKLRKHGRGETNISPSYRDTGEAFFLKTGSSGSASTWTATPRVRKKTRTVSTIGSRVAAGYNSRTTGATSASSRTRFPLTAKHRSGRYTQEARSVMLNAKLGGHKMVFGGAIRSIMLKISSFDSSSSGTKSTAISAVRTAS